MNRIQLIDDILKRLNINSDRLSLKWVSAAEPSRFVEVISEFGDRIKSLGPMGKTEGLERRILESGLMAAKLAMEGRKLRLIIARQAKFMKNGDIYRELPDDHKLSVQLRSTLSHEIAKQSLLLNLQEKPRSVEELCDLTSLSPDEVEKYIAELERRNLIDRDKMIISREG